MSSDPSPPTRADLLRAAVEALTTRCGPTAASTLGARSRLAALHADAGRVDEALEVLETLVADCETDLGPTHPQTVLARNNLAMRMAEAGRSGAVERLRSLAPIAAATWGPTDPRTLMIRGNLGAALGLAGRVDEAIAELEPLLDPGLPLSASERATVDGNLGSWRAARVNA